MMSQSIPFAASFGVAVENFVMDLTTSKISNQDAFYNEAQFLVKRDRDGKSEFAWSLVPFADS